MLLSDPGGNAHSELSNQWCTNFIESTVICMRVFRIPNHRYRVCAKLLCRAHLRKHSTDRSMAQARRNSDMNSDKMDHRISGQIHLDTTRDTCTDLGSNHRTYFDMLATEELIAVLRNLSNRPRSSKWKTFETTSDILSVLQTEGALSTAARSVFSRLILGYSVIVDTDFCVEIASDGDLRIVEELLGRLRSSLHTLILRCDSARVYAVAAMCSHLHTLEIWETDSTNYAGILSAMTGRLRALHIGGTHLKKRGIRAISEHCVGLTKLSLRFSLVACSLKRLWEAVGPSLIELSVGELYLDTQNQSASMHALTGKHYENDIANNCKMLTHFRFFRNSELQRSIYDIEAYGSQLLLLEMAGTYGCRRFLRVVSQFSHFFNFEI